MRILIGLLLASLSVSVPAAPKVELPPLAANGAITSSSVRWKERIRPIGGEALRIVCQLKGVYFTWKKPNVAREERRERGKRDIGFIAEEVGKIVPELVEWEVEGKHANGLKYDRISALTVEAIKEQQRVITQLHSAVRLHEERLCAHDTLLAAQQSRISALETQVCTLETSMTELKELVRELDFALADIEDAVAEIQPCTCSGDGGEGSASGPAPAP